MGKELVMRNATRDDLSLILAFKERLGEIGRTNAFYDWKYFQNKIARTHVYLVEDNSQIVSMGCLFPARMKIGGNIIICFQSGDTFTLPSYRGKGVFSKLYRELIAETETEGAKLIYGLPSDMFYPMMVGRFGFALVFDIKRFYYILNIENFLRGILNNKLSFYVLRFIARIGAKVVFRDVAPPVLDGLDVTTSSRFDDEVMDLWKRASKDYDAMIVRDKEYLNWRYTASPVKFIIYNARRKGRLVGYIVITLAEKTHKNVREGYIVDLLTDPEEERAAQTLMAVAFTYFKDQKADLIYTYAMQHKSATGDNFRRLIRRLGFIPSRDTSHFLIRTGLKLPDNCRYFFRLGDLDHV